MRAMAHHKTGIRFVMVVLLAVGLYMMPCGMVEHHGSMGAPPMLCIIDLPKVFQLVIVMNVLLFALSVPVAVPLPPAFSLLKPPRLAGPSLYP